MSLQADKWPNTRATWGKTSRRSALAVVLICLSLGLMGCANEQKVNPKELYIPVLTAISLLDQGKIVE